MQGGHFETGAFWGAAGSLADSYHQSIMGRSPDATPPRLIALCKDADIGSSCFSDKEGIDYIRDSDDTIARNSLGEQMVDMRTVPRIYSVVGESRASWAPADMYNFFSNPAAEGSPYMTAVSLYPGMNAMGFLHDQVADLNGWTGLELRLTIVPATALTYMALGTPQHEELVKQTNKEKKD
jgi:hypothetical protein